METLNQIGFVSAISLPFLLLLWRNRNWAAHPRRYRITLPLFGIGVLCLLAQYIVNADLKGLRGAMRQETLARLSGVASVDNFANRIRQGEGRC